MRAELWKNWWPTGRMQSHPVDHSMPHQINSQFKHLPEPLGEHFHSEISVFPAPGLIFLLPCGLFPRQPAPRGGSVSMSGAWESSVGWEGAPSLALAKQGRPAFVCASAPLVAKSSLKTRHKEAAEEPDKPPPISSPSCHDSPRLSG